MHLQPLPKQIYDIAKLQQTSSEPLLGSIEISKRIPYTQIWIKQNHSGDRLFNGYVGYVLNDWVKPIPGSTFILKQGPQGWYGYTLTKPQEVLKNKMVWISPRGRGEFDLRKSLQARVSKYQKEGNGTSGNAIITLNKGVWDGVKTDWVIEAPRHAGDHVSITYEIEKLWMRETRFIAPLGLDQVKSTRNYTIRPRR